MRIVIDVPDEAAADFEKLQEVLELFDMTLSDWLVALASRAPDTYYRLRQDYRCLSAHKKYIEELTKEAEPYLREALAYDHERAILARQGRSQ